jgi:putative transposase
VKLADYAKQMGVRYETAWRWFRDGKLQGRRIGPHTIAMLSYKAALVGMHVFVTEESSTSKASFLDGDPLPIYDATDATDATQPAPSFSGKRVKRGRYRAADGRHINADVNGSYNIIRKVAPDAFAQGSRGCVVHPARLTA